VESLPNIDNVNTFALYMPTRVFPGKDMLWIKFAPKDGKMEFKRLAGCDYECLAQHLPYYIANDHGTSTRTDFGKDLWDSHWGRKPVKVGIENQRQYYKWLLELGWTPKVEVKDCIFDCPIGIGCGDCGVSECIQGKVPLSWYRKWIKQQNQHTLSQLTRAKDRKETGLMDQCMNENKCDYCDFDPFQEKCHTLS